ncbi:MAG: polysaccharide pyruvyl transferase family protein [Anaerolineaceae bacterium]
MVNYSKERILLPRVIYGNRGDILSRWGMLNGLSAIGKNDIHVFAHQAGDLPSKMRNSFNPYGKYHNIMLSHSAKSELRNADCIFWGGGLDITDESSKAKLLYLLATFSQYKFIGKEIYCVFQGAGPLKTSIGRILAKQVLQKVTHFVARDKYTYDLVQNLNPQMKITLAGDAIFFPGFEQQIAEQKTEHTINHYLNSDGGPTIAINLRRWFHFSSDLIPFQLAKRRYETRGLENMNKLIIFYIDLVQKLRDRFNANILLISAYNPGVYSWEDDVYWLEEVKQSFIQDDKVRIVNEPLDMINYLSLMSKIDLAISMRLHTSLTALRFGNPAVNISYSPKGVNAFRALGLEENAFEINNILFDNLPLWNRVVSILENRLMNKEIVQRNVDQIMIKNIEKLESLF